MAGHGGGGPRTPTSGGVVAVVAVPEIGGAHKLPDAATAMASRSKGLQELSTPPTMVVGAKRRRWCSDEVRCGNTGLRWASSLAKVSTVRLSSWRNLLGVNVAFTATQKTHWSHHGCALGHGESARACALLF